MTCNKNFLFWCSFRYSVLKTSVVDNSFLLVPSYYVFKISKYLFRTYETWAVVWEMWNKAIAGNWGQVYFRFDFWKKKKDSKNIVLLFSLLLPHSFQKVDGSVSRATVRIASIRCKIKKWKLMFYFWLNSLYTLIFSPISIRKENDKGRDKKAYSAR